MLMFVMNNFWLFLAGILTAVAGLILLSERPKWNDYLAFGLIVGAVVVGWLILRPRQTPLMDDAKIVQARIGSGTPVLLEFQSPY